MMSVASLGYWCRFALRVASAPRRSLRGAPAARADDTAHKPIQCELLRVKKLHRPLRSAALITFPDLGSLRVAFQADALADPQYGVRLIKRIEM